MVKDRLKYLKHHITNAVTEGLNSKIQSVNAAARGFRSFKNYRVRILFFCGNWISTHYDPRRNPLLTPICPWHY
jgi:hypothetical protein